MVEVTCLIEMSNLRQLFWANLIQPNKSHVTGKKLLIANLIGKKPTGCAV